MSSQPPARGFSRPCRAAQWALRAALIAALAGPQMASAQEPPNPQPIVYKVQGTNDRLEMVINSSRILTMDQKVPQVQAANPELVELTPLSATQVQLLAKKAGVTQINLWDESQKIHTIDVVIFPDARELTMLLQAQFPTTALRVVPTANSVIISGHVDDPNQISRSGSCASRVVRRCGFSRSTTSLTTKGSSSPPVSLRITAARAGVEQITRSAIDIISPISSRARRYLGRS